MGATIIVCSKCNAKNRVPEDGFKRIPICGRCKSELLQQTPVSWKRSAYRLSGLIAVAVSLVSIPFIIQAGTNIAPDKVAVAKLSLAPLAINEPNGPVAKVAPTPLAVYQPDGPLSPFPVADPELTVITPNDNLRYFIMLVPVGRNSKPLKYLASGGSTFTIHAPIGVYTLMYASGSTWYGENLLFGRETAYSAGDDKFDFADDGNSYSTWTVYLYKVANGNFQTYR